MLGAGADQKGRSGSMKVQAYLGWAVMLGSLALTGCGQRKGDLGAEYQVGSIAPALADNAPKGDAVAPLADTPQPAPAGLPTPASPDAPSPAPTPVAVQPAAEPVAAKAAPAPVAEAPAPKVEAPAAPVAPAQDAAALAQALLN